MKIIDSTIDQEEIKKFEQIALEWWDTGGKFKPLHYLNPIRLEFIRDHIESNYPNILKSNIRVIDIGCGGGIVSEPLSNMGYDVTGIDASEINISSAKVHAEKSNSSAKYFCSSAEKFAGQKKKFDVVVALEIIEHVNNIPLFLDSLAKLLKPGGLMFISTINKNLKSYLSAIIVAEYVLRMLPVGTHSFDKFVKPSTIINILTDKNILPISLKGLKYNMLSNRWRLSTSADVNYIMALSRRNP